MSAIPTPKVDQWCELAMHADVPAVLDLARQLERDLAAMAEREKGLRDALLEMTEAARRYRLLVRELRGPEADIFRFSRAINNAAAALAHPGTASKDL